MECLSAGKYCRKGLFGTVLHHASNNQLVQVLHSFASMSCPCGLSQERVVDLDQRDRVPLVGGKCQNPLADGSDGVCGKALGAHPLAQALGGSTVTSAEWIPNTSSLRILGDDINGPHSTAIIVGRKTVLACAHSLDLVEIPVIKDESKRNTKRNTKTPTHYQYLEDYWVQSRFTKNNKGECTADDRVRIRLFKFHATNDWALFTRTDTGSFLDSDVAVIDTSLLTDPDKHLTHVNARVLHCPVSLVSSILKVDEFPVGCQISAVHIQAQSSHHVKYEGRDLCRGSSGGAVYVYPSSAILGMHSEAINEAAFEGEEEEPDKFIADTDKRVHSEDDPYKPFESAPEPKQKKVKSDSETIASIAGGINGLGSALIVCKFSRLMFYIRELEKPKVDA